MSNVEGKVIGGLIVPGMPHPLLVPEQNEGWASLRRGFEEARRWIERSGADLLVLYSTQWLSILGHQMQADPEPEWLHVDPEWHMLGSIPYKFRMDAPFADAYVSAARSRGLHARTVAYKGFPIDTGTIVALKLLNPDNRIPACVVSCNMYADRAETLVLGKAAADAVKATGRKALAVAVTALSNRMFTAPIAPEEDRISSLKDDEWNRKLLEILAEGRLEDVSQLAREFSAQANGDQRMKALWWLAACAGEHNGYDAQVLDYQAIQGTGAAIATLAPSAKPGTRLEFDEESVETYQGERNVLATADGKAPEPEAAAPVQAAAPAAIGAAVVTPPASKTEETAVRTSKAPKPVGLYPHARKVGDLLYLSGIGPRQAGTNEIPGGPVRDKDGKALDYDVKAQTRAVIENIRTILEETGSSLDKVVDATCFLIDMDRDFAGFNEVYGQYFKDIQPTRTTVEVRALPTPIAVELKVVARP